MEADELTAWIALTACPGLGPISIRQLLEQTRLSAIEFCAQPHTLLQKLGLESRQILALANPQPTIIEPALNWLEASQNHQLLSFKDLRYPRLLAELTDAPVLLYAVGNIDLLQQPQLAMVGSRHCTQGGAQTATEFARFLSSHGITITSGMASGIDAAAHQGALQGNGKTVAVIGTGIDRVYPPKNKQLAHQIAEQGLIISEFPLGSAPLGHHFPKRNRIISGLSLATLVVEAARNSGSLITARVSAEQGREVFAIPGSIHNPQVKGCHQLIRDGAKLVDQASDIIEELAGLLGYLSQPAETEASQNTPDDLDDDYMQLLDAMGYDPVSIDELQQRSSLTIETLSSMLLILELNDHIHTVPGGLYQRGR